MNKTQKKKEIVKRFLTFVENKFPQYDICDGDGGRIEFYPKGGKGDDSIEFHRSRLDLHVYSWGCDQSKLDVMEMECMLMLIQQEVEAIEI